LNTLDPETLNAYELGAKSEWFDGRLNVNASVFHYDYQDIQVNVVGPLPPTNVAVSYLQNVDQGHADGGEIEIEALPIQDLHIGGSVGILYTEFTDFQILNGGGNFSGNEFVRSPHFSTLLRADYRFPFELFGGTHLLAGGDWRYQSKQYFFTTNQSDPLLGEGGYSLVNARVSLVSPDEKLTLTAYANNLLDENYRNHALPGAAGATGAVTFWGEPRTVGVSLTARWW
jgi:iron complex outermembrane recepter protein